jgi:hypothetical protein
LPLYIGFSLAFLIYLNKYFCPTSIGQEHERLKKPYFKGFFANSILPLNLQIKVAGK